jgi:hypothetical protein
MQATQLKIQKYTLDVDIRSTRGVELTASVYVAEEMNADGRSERLQDIFDTDRFVPLRIDGKLELFSPAHLVWIRLDLLSALDELDPQAEQAVNSSSAHVIVELEDGSRIEGGVRYYMPAGARRVADYFQTAPRWIPVRTEAFVYLINRDRIVRVVPVEG